MINNFLLLFIFREPLDPGLKLAITLRHMATGATFRELMYSFRVADNTISTFIPTVLEAIVDTFQAEVMPPLIEPDEWREVSTRFNTKWNFPHACGALDGSLVEWTSCAVVYTVSYGLIRSLTVLYDR